MKIKVLVFGLSDNIGGMETYVYNAYRNMDHDKICFDFVTTLPVESSIAFEEYYKSTGSKIFHITKRTKNWLKSKQDIKKILSNNDYDYIHFHMMNYMWWEPIVLASKFTNSKIIVHSHNSKLDRQTYFKNYVISVFALFFFSARCRGNRLWGQEGISVPKSADHLPAVFFAQTQR